MKVEWTVSTATTLELYKMSEYDYKWCLFLYTNIAAVSPVSLLPPAHHRTSPECSHSYITSTSSEQYFAHLSLAQLNCVWGSAERTGHKWFPRGTAIPTQHSKDIFASKNEGQTLSGLVHNHFRKRKREHTHKNDSKHRRAQKHGKGHFSIGDNAYCMTFKHHKCYSAVCKSRKVSENTYLLCRKGKEGGESFTQRSTLT